MADQVTILGRPKASTIIGEGAGIVVRVDVTRNERHTLSSTLTEHPVEEGFNVTDHSRPDPDTVELECVISGTPLRLSPEQEQRRNDKYRAVLSSIRGGQPADSSSEEDTGIVDAAYRSLKRLRDEGTIVSVVTGLRTYESMAVQSVSIPRDSRSLNALVFNVSLKQIRVVRNRLTRVSVGRVQPKVKTGKQPPKQEEELQSVIFKSYDQNARGKTGTDAVTATVGGLIPNVVKDSLGALVR